MIEDSESWKFEMVEKLPPDLLLADLNVEVA
jgi:hypothetical protein